MKRFLFAMAGLCLSIVYANAAVLKVPADYPRIGDAYLAAQSGDEILVSPGIYTVNGTFPIQKKILLHSTFDGKDWNIVRNTVIKALQDQDLITIAAISSVAGTEIRGFTLTRDPITMYPGWTGSATGISSDGIVANVESCIIENCASSGSGAAIVGINGIIQNNIIRNCYSPGGAINCRATTICNNLLYNNGGAIYSTGNVFNNTIYNSGGIEVLGGGVVFNNIFWNSLGFSTYEGPAPKNCVISGYTGPGTGIITSDPKFVDPANGDFHLQSTSPAIDAGLTTTTTSSSSTPKADIVGVQRGLKAVGAPARGDGSGLDIGAYEYIPKPVAVWLPNGGPDTIHAGNSLTVDWQLDLATAGSAILLRLVAQDQVYANFGSFENASGADEAVVMLPTWLPSRQDYSIQGVSSYDQDLSNVTPIFSLVARVLPNAVRPSLWTRYH
jgi:hypothetical protein